MSNIGKYNPANGAENPISYAKLNGSTEKIQAFAKWLYDFRPVLEKEFDELEAKQGLKPNEVFPIKMEALSAIYKASEPLYKWYVENAKRQA